MPRFSAAPDRKDEPAGAGTQIGDRDTDEAATSSGELDSLVRFIARRLSAETTVLALVDEGGETGHIAAAFGLDRVRAPLTLGQGFVGRALLADEPVIERVDRPGEAGHLIDGVPVGAAAAAPVRAAGGTRGALCAGFAVTAELPDSYDEASFLRALTSYAAVVGLWLEDPETVIGLLRSAYQDGLTGCLTYSALMQALEQEVGRAERYAAPLACCFIDMDDFKFVNDREGHVVGNRVLEAIAAAILGRIRRLDVVGRYGGDEFVVVLPGTDGVRAAFLASALRDQIRLAAEEVLGRRIDVSLGLAEWTPGTDAEGLLQQADDALRESKLRRRLGR